MHGVAPVLLLNMNWNRTSVASMKGGASNVSKKGLDPKL